MADEGFPNAGTSTGLRMHGRFDKLSANGVGRDAHNHPVRAERTTRPAHRLLRFIASLLLCMLACGTPAKEAAPAAADPQLEAHMLRIAGELRCLVCQNQTIADSHADLAVDLREQVRVLLRRGQSDAQIVRYMTERYGDFVLYRPPLKATTWLLWFGPALLLAGGIGTLVIVLRRRARLGDAHFEPDVPQPTEEGLVP